MIIEINLENIDIIENSFISTTYLKNEFAVNPFAKVLILKESEETIGYIYYSDIYERVEINQMEISSFHRNCGKGGFLLKEMIKLVDKNITLEVSKNNLPAIRLYKKNGFKEKAIRRGYYQGTDGILMERKKK